MFLRHVHELFYIGRVIIGGLVNFVRYDVPCRFNLACGAVLIPNNTICGGETKENTGSGMCIVYFEATYPGLLVFYSAC